MGTLLCGCGLCNKARTAWTGSCLEPVPLTKPGSHGALACCSQSSAQTSKPPCLEAPPPPQPAVLMFPGPSIGSQLM